MSDLNSRLPAASCVAAVFALILALACWAVQVEWLNPIMALTSAVLTIAGFAMAIVGIVAFRHGPRRLAVTAWIGLLLCVMPLAFWALMLWILVSIEAGHPL